MLQRSVGTHTGGFIQHQNAADIPAMFFSLPIH